MELEHNHTFAHDDARERVRALGEYLSKKHGMQVEWVGPDTARIRGKYTVLSLDVNVTVQGDRVVVQGDDPGFLLRSTAKKYIAGKLTQYLDPAKDLARLPRQ